MQIYANDITHRSGDRQGSTFGAICKSLALSNFTEPMTKLFQNQTCFQGHVTKIKVKVTPT